MIKKFQELTMADDFLFGEVMRHEEVCKKFLEELLGKKIREIHYIERQADLTDGYELHGIRLDVYLDDDEGTIYNVEMQNSKDKLPRRIRYYQSGIDRRTLEKSKNYKDLKESYVIFVCNYDHFERGLAVYERISTLRGCEDVVYDDGSHAFILNSRYTVKNANEPIIQFLDYIREGKPTGNYDNGSLVDVVHKTVSKVKNNSEKEGMYMTFSMKMAELERVSEEKGVAKERLLAAKVMAKNFGCSIETAMQMLKSEEESEK